MTTGFCYDPRFLNHDTGTGHPERPQRLSSTISYLERQAWFTGLRPIAASLAPMEAIGRIHTAEYIAHARSEIASGVSYLDSRDVAVSSDSFEVAQLATGAALNLCDAVMAGQIRNGFSLARPPGHHAEAGEALGFCIFNNIAIAARHLQAVHGLERIAILDWDVHHGNGTQHSFDEDPSVLYISTHQYPFYPGTGAATETGIGAGIGSILNCPLPAGSGAVEYELAFHEQILPKLHEFKPEFILISCGFDAHENDPLGSMELPTDFFGAMTAWMMEVADVHCAGRIVSLLEGGYDIEAMQSCTEVHLRTLMSAMHPTDTPTG